MSIVCPSCQFKLSPKASKPGRYQTKCPECGRPLVVTIAADGSASASAVPDATLAQAEPAPPPRDVTVAFDGPGPVPADEGTAETDLAPSDKTHTDRGATIAGEAEPVADSTMPAVVSNYEIVRQLGKGGMGAVYLARQRSLDRLVALKVIDPRWARDPRFLVRFTREAYAAAQLVHHNVVQVYDIGADRGIHWFSMEYVEGTTLGEVLQAKGRLDPNTAAGYILQAARGLQFAHERGMIHRDVKPDNLMLNQLGIVKVADLGLVRTPGTIDVEPAPTPAGKSGRRPTGTGTLAGLSGVTLATQTVGTPSYMAPEQTRSASNVDARTDIYSLGCTFYTLVTGRTVFTARTATEMLLKQQHEPVTPPQTIVKELPPRLGDVIVKMLAKKPADRYQNCAQVVRALEAFLGIGIDARTRLAQEKAEMLARGVQAFHAVAAARRRRLILAGGLALCGLAVVVALCAGAWLTAGSFLGLAVLTPLAWFVVNGVCTRSHLFLQARQYVLGNDWRDWLKAAGGLLLLLFLLYLAGLLLAWLLVCVVAVGVAFALHFLVDRPIERQRAGALAEVDRMLKGLRLRGIAEDALHKYVCQFAGEHWEEPFEALFGYEAKLAARAKWGKGLKGPRPRFAAWRDPLMRWLQARQRQRQEARERRYLQVVEQEGLVAGGMQPVEAQRQAEATAEAMVEKAAQLKVAELVDDALVEEVPAAIPEAKALPAAEKVAEAEPAEPPRRPRVDVRALVDVAEQPPKRRPTRRLGRLADLLLGSGGRFLLGTLLAAAGACGAYLSQIADDVRKLAPRDVEAWETLLHELVTPRSLLDVPLVPELLVKPMTCLAAVVAGFLLLLSSFQPLRWRSLLHYGSAVLAVAGPMLGVPSVGPVDATVVSLAAGAGLALLLLFQGRARER